MIEYKNILTQKNEQNEDIGVLLVDHHMDGRAKVECETIKERQFNAI